MKITHLALGTLLVSSLTAGVSSAGSDRAGTTAANFLSVGSGPAILGRAGATLGLSGDIDNVAWNAGSLGFLSETQLSISHATLIGEHAQEYLAAGGRLGATDLRWALSGLYESEGSFEGRDALNNSTGIFNVSSFAAGGHMAYPIAGMASLGLGAKWVNENLGDARGQGATFDAGLQAHFGMLGIGLAAQNAFGKMRFGTSPYDFPTNYGVGVSLDHAESGLRLAVDANFPTAYYTDVRTGVEWRWRDLIALRGGYRAELGAPSNETLSGPTFGFGAGAYGMWLDYGYIVPGTGDAQHRIGVSLRPGRMNQGGGAVGQESAPRPIEPRRVERPAEPQNSEAHATPRLAPTADPVTPAAVPQRATVPVQAAQPSAPESSPVVAPAAKAVEPAKAVESVKAAEPVKAIRPVKTVQSVKAAEPAKAVETVKSAVPAAPPATQSAPEEPRQVAPAPAPQSAKIAPAPAEQSPASPPQAETKREKKQSEKKSKRAKKVAEAEKPKDSADESDDPFDAVIQRAKNMKPGQVKLK